MDNEISCCALGQNGKNVLGDIFSPFNARKNLLMEIVIYMVLSILYVPKYMKAKEEWGMDPRIGLCIQKSWCWISSRLQHQGEQLSGGCEQDKSQCLWQVFLPNLTHCLVDEDISRMATLWRNQSLGCSTETAAQSLPAAMVKRRIRCYAGWCTRMATESAAIATLCAVSVCTHSILLSAKNMNNLRGQHN